MQTDTLWRDETLAPDDEIRQTLSAACEQAGIDLDAAVLGFKAAQYVDRGRFVPDDITNALFEAAFVAAGGGGLALDGYPRTPEQSTFLLDLAARTGSRIDLILMVENNNEAIISRTIGRRICPNRACGKVFHLQYKPPAEGGLCTACGTPVVLRSDDTEDKIRTRLAEFQAKAWPAIQALVATGIPMVTVPGNLPVFTSRAVKESVMGAIEPVLGTR